MKIVNRNPSELVAAEYNPRKLSPEQRDQIRSSLDRFGFVDPVIVNRHPDRNGIIVGGHQRVSVAIDMGLAEVPTVEVELTPEREKELNVRLNRNTGEWDWEVLAEEFEIPDLKGWGFTDDELAQLDPEPDLSDVDAEPQTDRAAELAEQWGTERGQVWQCGDHRVMCGDSTSAEDVGKLVGDESVVVCITDPPYSVNYDRSMAERGGNASAHNSYTESDIGASDVLSFMNVVPCDVMIWSYPIDRHFQTLAKAHLDFGWEFKKELVWVKDSFSFWMGAKYQQQHEPMMISVRQGKPIGGDVPSDASTVMQYPRPKAHDMHCTAKPVELWSVFVKNHSGASESIYNPFLGSGTTLIACEQLNRKCYGMEIDPGYVGVILQRYLDATGKEPVKL